MILLESSISSLKCSSSTRLSQFLAAFLTAGQTIYNSILMNADADPFIGIAPKNEPIEPEQPQLPQYLVDIVMKIEPIEPEQPQHYFGIVAKDELIELEQPQQPEQPQWQSERDEEYGMEQQNKEQQQLFGQGEFVVLFYKFYTCPT